LSDENKRLRENSHASVSLAQELKAALTEIKALKDEVAANKKSTQEQIKQAIRDNTTEEKVRDIINSDSNSATANTSGLKADPKRRPSRNKGFSYGKPNDKTALRPKENPFSEPLRPKQQNSSNESVQEEGRNSSLFTVIEDNTQPEDDADSKEIYVPKGSILTGVLITGLDAPTQSSASENPVPVLVRLKKEAILPNYATVEEVRECFALMAGYGELSTERANLRGESITCVKQDGSVIEKNFGSYAVGEDGKAGLKGTLVTRNSTILANAMMAGFASGLSAMFNVDAVPTISTDSSGNVQYDSVYSSSAIQGGAATGASNAMERLADYYMELADAMHPVIEVGAGRVVDMIITKGTTL
jgi:conjugal transfer pilus assembly protein TraB